MELTEVEIWFKPNDECIYLHGYCDDMKVFGVLIGDMNEEKALKLSKCFEELGLNECGVLYD